jgi:hypothetical protein
MEIDPTNIRELVSDLDEVEKNIDLMKQRVRLIKRDLLTEISGKKPVVRDISKHLTPGGRTVDLRKYRSPGFGK